MYGIWAENETGLLLQCQGSYKAKKDTDLKNKNKKIQNRNEKREAITYNTVGWNVEGVRTRF